MHSALYYIVSISSIILVAGSAMMFIALRNAPDGYETEEGFVGLTRGDEVLLNEYAAQRAALLGLSTTPNAA